MERTLSNFIRALRNAEVRVSTAETLDAFNAMDWLDIGIGDSQDALSLVCRNCRRKEPSTMFDSFFSFRNSSDPPSARRTQ
jgi:uncharacterized protein with von Willebrand factor type A (vWA) domain